MASVCRLLFVCTRNYHLDSEDRINGRRIADRIITRDCDWTGNPDSLWRRRLFTDVCELGRYLGNLLRIHVLRRLIRGYVHVIKPFIHDLNA